MSEIGNLPTRRHSTATRIAAVVILILFAGFMFREAVLGECAVDRAIPSGHVPTP